MTIIDILLDETPLPLDLCKLIVNDFILPSQNKWKKIYKQSLDIIKRFVIGCYQCDMTCESYDEHESGVDFIQLTSTAHPPQRSVQWTVYDPYSEKDYWIVLHPDAKKCLKHLNIKWKQIAEIDYEIW